MRSHVYHSLTQLAYTMNMATTGKTQEHSCTVLDTTISKTLLTKLKYLQTNVSLRFILATKFWTTSERCFQFDYHLWETCQNQNWKQTWRQNYIQIRNLTLPNSRITNPLLLSNHCGHCDRWQREEEGKTLNVCNMGEPRTLSTKCHSPLYSNHSSCTKTCLPVHSSLSKCLSAVQSGIDSV